MRTKELKTAGDVKLYFIISRNNKIRCGVGEKKVKASFAFAWIEK